MKKTDNRRMQEKQNDGDVFLLLLLQLQSE